MTDSSIIGKILITGNLLLKSPLLIGDGQSQNGQRKTINRTRRLKSPLLIDDGQSETDNKFRDVHVLKNSKGTPFIPGTSLCGVLREWLEKFDAEAVPELFGNMKKMQSSIQIDDIPLENYKIIFRDGVRIDGLTDTVDGDGKFDFEVVERGATGNLRMLINLRGIHSTEKMSATVSCLLKKLQDGINLGAFTTKGFGLVSVKNLSAEFYNFRNKADVAAWFLQKPATSQISPSDKNIDANEKNFIVDAEFAFNSSFIIRDYESAPQKISAVTLKSLNDFVVPGTSLKGILRHRAKYICEKIGVDSTFLENLMGTTSKRSRFFVAESYISTNNFSEVEHSRTKIDRFTGGPLQGTLFTTIPAYQKSSDTATFKLHFEIRNTKNFEAGLAILLLRDLWLGRVAIGGEKSVGRGTLKGLSAQINFGDKTYKLGENGKIIEGDKTELETLVTALKFAGGDDE